MFSECKSTLPMLRNGYMAVTFQLRFCYDNVTRGTSACGAGLLARGSPPISFTGDVGGNKSRSIK